MEFIAHGVAFFQGLHSFIQVSIGVVATVSLLVGLVFGLIKLGRRSLRRLMAAVTILLGITAGSMAAWTFTLPASGHGPFVVQHEAIRLSATLSVTLFTLFVLGHGVPVALRLIEKGGFAPFVAARHVRSEKSGFLTVISLLSMGGVGLSSLMLCCVVSIMGGFGADLRTKILNNNAQVRVESVDGGTFEYWREALNQVRVQQGVVAATPVVAGEVMASSSTNTAGMMVKGIEPDSIAAVIDVPAHTEVGSFKYLSDPEALAQIPADTPIGIGKNGERFLKGPIPEYEKVDENDPLSADVLPGVVLGRELARSLHVYVGERLSLVSPMGSLGPMGLMPRIRKFRVAGIFYTGMYEYDASQAYVALEDAQELLDVGHLVTSIDARVDDIYQTTAMLPGVTQALKRDDLKVRDWKLMNRNLFSALKFEKIAIFVVLLIAVLVASFCIICTLLLMVTEKSKEIAILKAMGATSRTILRLFLFEGMFIGGAGTIIGVVTGWVLMVSLQWFGFRVDPEVYYVQKLPINVDELDYLLIALSAFVITSLAVLYPAYAASSVRPIDGVRHE